MSTIPDSTLRYELDLPALEDPTPPEGPGSGLGGLIPPEHQSRMATKLALAETFLELITRNIKFDQFMSEVLLAIVRVFKVEAGTIFELNQQTQTLFFRAVCGQASHQVNKFTVPMGKGIVGHVAQSRRPKLVQDVTHDALHLNAIPLAVGFEVQNIIAVPILVRGQVYGVLELLNRVGRPSFTEQDLDLLESICQLTAHTIEVRLVVGWALQEHSALSVAA